MRYDRKRTRVRARVARFVPQLHIRKASVDAARIDKERGASEAKATQRNERLFHG